MASATTVTIDRSYFETLVRRSQFNTDAVNSNAQVLQHSVSLSKTEYDHLHLISKKYENLRKNLLEGGIDEATINVLSQDDATIRENRISTTVEPSEDGGARLTATPFLAATPQPSSRLFDPPRVPNGHSNSHGYNPNGPNFGARRNHGVGPHHDQSTWADADPDPTDDASFLMDIPGADVPDADVPNGQHSHEQLTQRPQFDRQCTRTVQLLNLADGITHADITNAVRGGILLDIFLRGHERSAMVSFLHAIDARGFFDHVRKHDLYIKNKRVEVKWAERQFTLPGHVASKIGIGATRNFVIRRCDARHTEESIREDLEHIHNLVVIKVEFQAGSCYIRTNSVHNAMFARTCMMSRQKYKGCKIEWDVDECARPFDPVPELKPRREAPIPKRVGTAANRFFLLNLDDDEHEDEITTTFQSKKSAGIAA